MRAGRSGMTGAGSCCSCCELSGPPFAAGGLHSSATALMMRGKSSDKSSSCVGISLTHNSSREGLGFKPALLAAAHEGVSSLNSARSAMLEEGLNKSASFVGSWLHRISSSGRMKTSKLEDGLKGSFKSSIVRGFAVPLRKGVTEKQNKTS